MRIAYAWLLLGITLSNWIGGFLYVEISHYVEVRHEMNAMEQTIATVVQQSIGAASAVKVLDQQPRLKGDVYGDGAFATEVSGEAVYYTLIDDHADLQKVTESSANPASSDKNHTILIKSFLQEFEVTRTDFSIPSVITPSQTLFSYQDFTKQFFTNILTPPPNFA